MTTTDDILALATAAADSADGAARGDGVVTEADVAAFRAAAARGADSAVVRALLGARPVTGSLGQPAVDPVAPSALSSGDPAWTAWLTAAAAASGATGPGEAAVAGEAAEPGEASMGAGKRTAAAPRPIWCAVFGAAVALIDHPGSGASADDLAAAVTAGLGAAALVQSGLDDWGGWSSGSVAATMGAGVTAGRLLDLTGSRLRAAIGICATQAAGLRAAEGTDAFPLQAGKAAFNGVEAALLAQAGVTAPAEPLDGRRGLFALFGS